LQEKRGHDRYTVELTLEIRLRGETYPGTTRDLSLGGMFVHTEAPLKFGEEAEIRLSVPALKYDGVLPVIVRWAGEGGVGVAFRSLRARDVHTLNQLFRGQRER
jgi:hypothetical protein